MKIISVQMSFKIHFCCGNSPLCSGVIAISSGPKSHTFTVILVVFAPPAKMESQTVKRSFVIFGKLVNLAVGRHIYLRRSCDFVIQFELGHVIGILD